MKNIFIKKFSKVVCIFTVIANQKRVAENVNFYWEGLTLLSILNSGENYLWNREL